MSTLKFLNLFGALGTLYREEKSHFIHINLGRIFGGIARIYSTSGQEIPIEETVLAIYSKG